MHMTHFNELSELYTKVSETVGKKIIFSKLDLCEGGSIWPTIFKSDITTFRVLYLFVHSSLLSEAKLAENLHIVLSSPY